MGQLLRRPKSDQVVSEFEQINAEQRRLDPSDAAEQLRLWERGYDLSQSAARLRHIAVHVQELSPGHYQWVLSEQLDAAAGLWVELESSTEVCDHWSDAVTAGCVALHRFAPDERFGPRVI